MASRYYYVFTVTGISIIVVSVFLAATLFFKLSDPLAGSSILVLVFIETVVYISRLNTINRKIAAFFNAVYNQDTSMHLPKSPGSGVISDIYRGMEKTMEVIQSIKMESAFRENLFMAMIENSTTGFISIDDRGDFQIMNETARKLLGVEYTSNLERLKIVTPELYETLIKLKPGQSQSCSFTHNNSSGIVQVTSSRLKYKDKNFTLVSLLDIQREIDARELESWQKLIRIMNHEIMNSIAPITSVSKSLMKIFFINNQPVKKEDLTDKTIKDITSGMEVIDTMSNGLSYFVENYRKLSRIPEPIIKEIDIRKWAETLKQILPECTNSNGADLEIQADEKLKTFYGDERLLNQVIVNLVKNAAEAQLKEDRKLIKVKFLPSLKGNLDIRVWNNGHAIDEDTLDKIFIPFFTTKEEGAGIGLYVSRRIVDLHNGSITVVSDMISGTTFTISV